MQTQADIIGAPVMRPTCVESTAMGAAYLAGLGSGFWRSTDDIVRCWVCERVFSPSIDAAEREKRLHGWKRAVACATGWAEE